MEPIHLSRHLLIALEKGTVSGELVRRELVRHLAARCSTCASELRRWNAWRRLRSTDSCATGVARALDMLLPHAFRTAREAEEEWTKAKRDFATLRALPPGNLFGRIDRARTRFRGGRLAELCLRECRASLPDRPRCALRWAEAAERIVSRGRAGGRRAQDGARLVLALAHQGNAHRVLDDLSHSEALFAAADRLVREAGVTDLRAVAELSFLQASLDRARRRFERAEEHLDRAALLYRVLNDRDRLVQTTLARGSLFHAAGHLERALEATARAAESLPPDANPRLHLTVRHNLGDTLCELGRFTEAQEILEEARHLYELFDDPWTACRLAWLEGKIARGRGHRAVAEERLRAARRGFVAAGSAYDAALVSLELAALHLELGHTLEVQRLAREMVSTFRALGAHREALHAARLFAGAAARERVSLGLVARLGRYFHHARHDPHFAFDPDR